MRDWGYEKVGFWLIRVRARDMIRVTIQIIKEMRNLKNIYHMRRIREVIGIRLVKHSIGKSEYVNRMDGNYIMNKTVSDV